MAEGPGYRNSRGQELVPVSRHESLFGPFETPSSEPSQQDNDLVRQNPGDKPIVTPDTHEPVQQQPHKRMRAASPSSIEEDAQDSEDEYPAHPRQAQSNMGRPRKTGDDKKGRETAQMKTPEVDDTPAVGPSTVDACVEKVIGIFPHISRKFVRGLCVSHDPGEPHEGGGLGFVQHIIDTILEESSYPKEEKASKRKRHGDEEDSDGQWVDEGTANNSLYATLA